MKAHPFEFIPTFIKLWLVIGRQDVPIAFRNTVFLVPRD